MNATQMLHQRYVKGLREMLVDTTKKRTRSQRAALEAKLAEAIAFERAHPEIVA